MEIYNQDRYRNGSRWKCILDMQFLWKDYKSSYTRVRCHLLKIQGKGIGICMKVQMKDLLEMEKLELEVIERKKNNAARNVPLPPSSLSTDSI